MSFLEEKSSRTDEDWMEAALDIAKKSPGQKIGALVVLEEELISTGQSLCRQNCDPTAHAEINAIRLAAEKLGSPHLKECILYTTLEPCAMCLHASAWACLKRVVFAADHTVCSPELYDRKSYSAIEAAEGLYPYHGIPLEITGGVLAEPAAELLKGYQRKI